MAATERTETQQDICTNGEEAVVTQEEENDCDFNIRSERALGLLIVLFVIVAVSSIALGCSEMGKHTGLLAVLGKIISALAALLAVALGQVLRRVNSPSDYQDGNNGD